MLQCLLWKGLFISMCLKLNAWLSFLVPRLAVLASHVFVFLSFLLWSPVPLYTHDPFPLFCSSPSHHHHLHIHLHHHLCSGDCPKQRSGASWQRAYRDLSLSGDHQWDLHSRACAKLAGGLPQSRPHHSGVCVATLSLSCSLINCVSVVYSFFL